MRLTQRSCERSPAEFWSKPLHACMALSGTGARLLHSDSEVHMPHMPGVLVRRAKAMFAPSPGAGHGSGAAVLS